MAGYAVTAPLNAAGPWGTAAWLVGGTLLTIAAAVGLVELEKEVSKTRSVPVEKVETKTKTKESCKRYTVFVRAQGSDLGGTTTATVGAPALTLQVPVLVMQGLTLSTVTKSLLTKTQLKIRLGVIAQAESYIITGPMNGGRYGEKDFVVKGVRGGIRYDVGCWGCGPSFIA